MCNSSQQPTQNWAARAAAVAQKAPPPEKLKLLPMTDTSWTAFCTKCVGGFNDPTKTLVSCPLCKSDLITGGEKKPATAVSPLGTLSKPTIACQQLLAGIGPDGVVPKTQEDKAKEDEITRLKAAITTLEGMKDGDFGVQIKDFQKKIKDLEKTVVSPDVQLLKDQSAIQYSLAELEQKHANIKLQLEDQVAK